jgi:nitric oxide synthase-interacting protein
MFFSFFAAFFPSNNLPLSGRGIKRKFAFDSTAAEKVVQEAEEAALRQIEREQAAALRSKLPDFWLPSLTPTYTSSGPPSSLADVKVRTTCRGGNPPHPILYARGARIYTISLLIPPFRLKTLIPVNFTWQPQSSRSESTNSTPADDGASNLKGEERDAMCPSCKKTLSNSLQIYGTSLGL